MLNELSHNIDVQKILENTPQKILEKFAHMSEEELHALVKEKYTILLRMIKFSRNQHLKLKPYESDKKWEGTFACGLGKKSIVYIDKYIKGKITIEDIPEECFQPKYIYYRLPWLLEKPMDVIVPIMDHEFEHAESSDYKDIFVNTRKAIEKKLPYLVVNEFFNAVNEDPFVGNKQIAKGYAKKQWVKNLYTKMFLEKTETDKDKENSDDKNIDILSEEKWKRIVIKERGIPRIQQLIAKMQYEWMNRAIIQDDPITIEADPEVEEIFAEILPHFDDLIDPNIPNSERIEKKNTVLWPYLEALLRKDIYDQTLRQFTEKMQELRKKKQEDIKKQTQEEIEKNLQQPQGDKETKEGDGEINQSWENKGGKEWGKEEGNEEGKEWENKWENKWEKEWNKPWEEWNKPWEQWGDKETKEGDEETNKSWGNEWALTEEQIKEMMKNMTEEEKEALEKDAIDRMDKEAQKKMEDEMSGIDWSELSDEDKKDETAEEKKSDKTSEETQEQKDKEEKKRKDKNNEIMKKIQDMVEQREKDIKKKAEIEKEIEDLNKIQDDLDDFKRAKERTKELEKEIENIKTPDLKKDMDKKIKQKTEQIKKRQESYERKLQKMGFTPQEERYYKQYINREKMMEKEMERFIEDLSREIPKIKTYTLEWYYNSGRVHNVIEAAIKMKTGQHDVFYKKLEHETVKIDLWICLSIDVSISMAKKMSDVMNLTIFLGLLCQIREIPFQINAFGETFHSIKAITEEYNRSKAKVIKLGNNLEWWTNISIAVENNLNAIKNQLRITPETTFLPIFITDGGANLWKTWTDLAALTRKFNGLDLIFAIGLNNNEIEETKAGFPKGKLINLEDAAQIMTKGKKELMKYFIKHREKIFKWMQQ